MTMEEFKKFIALCLCVKLCKKQEREKERNGKMGTKSSVRSIVTANLVSMTKRTNVINSEGWFDFSYDCTKFVCVQKGNPKNGLVLKYHRGMTHWGKIVLCELLCFCQNDPKVRWASKYTRSQIFDYVPKFSLWLFVLRASSRSLLSFEFFSSTW